MSVIPVRTDRGAASTGLVVLVASIALGGAGAVVVYRAVAGPPVPTATTPSPEVTRDDAPAGKPKVRFAPCEPPAVLEAGVCVTDVVRTVVVPAAPAPGPAPARARADRDREGATGRGRGPDQGDSPDDDRDDHDDRDDDRDDRDDRDDDRDNDRDDDRDDDRSGSGDGDDDRDDRDDDREDDRDDD